MTTKINQPIFFNSVHSFRHWLIVNHLIEKELIVGFYKVASGKPSMTWSDSVDQALCFGWIDGIRKSIDSESYCIRFTPRKSTSIWSKINIEKVEKLTKAGLMYEAGLNAFSKRNTENSGIYSFENELKEFSEHQQTYFANNEKAWKFFNLQAPSYKKTMIYWVNSAKQEKTQLSRLLKLINASENQKRIF